MGMIDYRDLRPIYEQISDHYKQLILAGVLQTDEQLPSVRTLATELSTNPNTVQKAFSQLLNDGFIYTVKGRGNYVADKQTLLDDKRSNLIIRLKKIRSEAAVIGFDINELWEESSK